MRRDDAVVHRRGVSNKAISIRPAAHEDVDDIAALAADYDLSELSDADARTDGFLVSAFSIEEYHDFVDRAEHFYVARDPNGLVGFLLAYTSERIRSSEWLNMQLKDSFAEPFVLIKQICVARRHTSRGVASALYRALFRNAPRLSALTALVRDPPNQRSVSFHERHGFRLLTAMTPPDGLPRTVWIRSPVDPETALGQYTVAAELYRHEDSLNWSKLNNLFYVSGGLAAILGIASEISDNTSDGALWGLDDAFWALVLGVSVIGVLVSLAFAVSLHWGVTYMQERKAAVIGVEEELLGAGGVPVVSLAQMPELRARRFQRSPTATVLRVMPWMFGVGWLTAAVVAIVALIR